MCYAHSFSLPFNLQNPAPNLVCLFTPFLSSLSLSDTRCYLVPPPCPVLAEQARRCGGGNGGEVLTTSCVYVCMVWPHRQLPALAGGEQATSRQNELPSPTQLSERSRELRPHQPRYLRRSARTPKLQQCTLHARRFVGDQGEGVGRTTYT